MFDRIMKIISGSSDNKKSTKDLEQKTHIAACVLLFEAAHIDNQCTEDEMAHLVSTLKDKFSLSPENTEELLKLAHEEWQNSIDLWQFTNHMNQHFSQEEKISVMEDVWRIIFIDGQLEQHEDHFAHKLANLLRLTHKQLIDAKLKAREQLAG